MPVAEVKENAAVPTMAGQQHLHLRSSKPFSTYTNISNMNNPVNLALGQLFSQNQEIPAKLVRTADNFVLQSRQKIVNLRPDEEAARYLICAQLAVEVESEALRLPAAKKVPAPIPPKMFQNLTNVFRNSLGLFSASTPSPRKSPVKTPRKAIKVAEREGSPSPRKRGGPKTSDPMSQDIEHIAAALGLSDPCLEAIVKGYKTYHNLVRERWGLLLGLTYVVISRGHPQLIRSAGKARLLHRLIMLAQGSSMTTDKLQEWIVLTETIVGEQSWIQQLESEDWVRPEKTKRKRLVSGIGNMVSWTMDLSNPERINDYENWQSSILKRVREA